VQPVAFLQWLEKTPLALLVSQSIFGFSALDMIHIAAISVVFGMIAVVDLRLLGVASKDCAVTDICRQALPWTWVAFGIAALTGVLMFMGQSVKYYNNYAFRMKVLLMLLAGINMLVFQLLTSRGAAKWDRERAAPLAGKIAGALSLAFWIAIVFFGRRIGFTMISA